MQSIYAHPYPQEKKETKNKNLLVRMLPRINPQNRSKLPNNRILIRIRANLNTPRLRILHQPRPPAPLNPRQRGIELLLERIQTAVTIINSRRQLARRRLASALAGRRQVLPEQAVVDVAAAVEVDHRLQGDLSGDIVVVLGFFDLRAEVVVGGYVGVVVVFVVEFHYFAADGGLEGAVVVWEGLCQWVIFLLKIYGTYMAGRAELLFRVRMWCLRDRRGSSSWEQRRAGRSGVLWFGGVLSSWLRSMYLGQLEV
jgi:hypothetical protein